MNILEHKRKALGHKYQEPTTLITAALIGAASGAVVAVVTGGDILKGALMGAIGGAIGFGIAGAVGGTAASAASGVEGAALGAAEGAVGTAATSGFDASFITGFSDGGTAAMSSGGSAIGGGGFDASFTNGFSDGGTAFTPPTGTGMSTAGPTGMAGPQTLGDSGISQAGTSTGMGGPTSGNTGMSAPVNPDMAAVPPNPNAGGGSFLDTLMGKAKGMVSSRGMIDMGGRMLQGYAQGNAQQAALDARAAEIEKARANARFGVTGSRYNTAGMIGATNSTYK